MPHLLPVETRTNRLRLGTQRSPRRFRGACSSPSGPDSARRPGPRQQRAFLPGVAHPTCPGAVGRARHPAAPPPAASSRPHERERVRARGPRDLPEASAAVGEGVSRTCVSARVRARVCPSACLAVRAEPGRTDSRGADGLSPWCGRRPPGGSGSRQSPSREAAPTRDPRSGGCAPGAGRGGASVRARVGVRGRGGRRRGQVLRCRV